MIRIVYSYTSKEKHQFLMEEVLPGFSVAFQNKIRAYRNWNDAQLSLLGRVLLDQEVRRNSDATTSLELHYTSFKKPYLKNEKIQFNISHSGDIVVCAISENTEIGIDIEIIKDINIADFRSQMTTFEWNRIFTSDNVKNSFFTYWTQKEAVLKADGRGLSIPLQSFEVINCKAQINNTHFSVKEIKLDNQYKCHLAFKNIINETIDSIQCVDVVKTVKNQMSV